MLRYKMILRVLLLFSFTCCVSETFRVNVAQSFYQAEENQDITVELSFTAKDNIIEIFCEKSNDPWARPVFPHGIEEVPQSQDEQFADQVQCDENVPSEMSNNQKAKVLFHLREGEKVPQSQVEQFAGRVQCDKAALSQGRVRLHVSKLRIEDSGLYQCEVVTSTRVKKKAFYLSVTAAKDEPESEKQNTERDPPEAEKQNIVKVQPVSERQNTAKDQPVSERQNTAKDQPESEKQDTAKDQPESEKQDTASQGGSALYWSLVVTAATAVLLVVGCIRDQESAEPRSANSSSHPKNQGRSVRVRKTYQVVVYGIRGEKVTVDLCNTEEQMKSMTVLQLKEKIAQKLRDTAGLDNLRLIFTDKALEEDTDLLSGYGIQHMSVIHIVLKVPGGLTA